MAAVNVNQLSWPLTKWLVLVLYLFVWIFFILVSQNVQKKTKLTNRIVTVAKTFSQERLQWIRVFSKNHISHNLAPRLHPLRGGGSDSSGAASGGVVRYTIPVYRSPYFHELWIRLRWLFMELFSSALWSAKPLIALKNNVVCLLPVEMWTNNLFFQNFLVD